MFITKKRLNEIVDKAVNEAREEMLMNERFNDLYRYIEDDRRAIQQEIIELHRRIDELVSDK